MLIIKNGQPWVKLDDLRENVYNFALSLSTKFYKNAPSGRPYDFSRGLPKPDELIEKKEQGPNRRFRIERKKESTRNRFLDQFVCRTGKVGKISKITGASVEMGLITIKPEGDSWLVTLTNNGKDFAHMNNGLLKIGTLDTNVKTEHVFLPQEVEFITKKIIPQFKLEKIITEKILSIKNSFTLTDLENIFRDEKMKYLHEKYKDSDLDQIGKNNKLLGKKDVIDELTEKYIEYQRIGTVGRLIELNLIVKDVSEDEIRYVVLKKSS